MKQFGAWLAASPWGTALKSAIAVVLTLALADWTTSGSISFGKWQTWLIAAFATAVPVIVNALNSADTRYGRGSAAPDA